MFDPSDQCVLDEGAADGVAVVQLTTDTVDAANSEAVGRDLAGYADELSGRRLSLDFGGIQFLTASGLGMLVTFRDSVRVSGGQLTVANAQPFVYGVFEACRLTKAFNVRKPTG